jgi:hypothetical protein
MTGPGPSDPSGQAPPPPDPAAPQASPPGAAPEWTAKAQEWRPAAVAAGPAAGIGYADLTTRIVAYIIDVVILVIVGFV